MTTSKREQITPVLAELHWLSVAARIDFKIAVTVITFNLLIAEQPSYLCELLQLRRPWRSLRLSNHNLLNIPRPRTAFYSGVFPTLPLVSGIHSVIQTLMIWTSLHQSLNSDLRHSSTEGPISINNHSVTLTALAICLIGQHTACF